MELEVLLSTMNLKNYEEAENLIKKMNIKTKISIINQVQDEVNIFDVVTQDVNIYSYKEKGLSKSRNKAINILKGDVGIFADDDIRYEDDYKGKIERAYEKYKDADIIVFYVESENPKRIIKKQKNHKLNYITAMKVQSSQITFNKKSIINQKIEFDENFGAGAKYYMGEESILLYECLKKKMKIYYIDEKIGKVEQNSSSWYKGYNKDFFQSEGSIFYRIFPHLYYILIFQYAIRKHKIYYKESTIRNAIKNMIIGAKKYKEGY